MKRIQIAAAIFVVALASHSVAADPSAVRVLAFSPDGTILVAGTGGRGQGGGVTAYDVATRKPLWQHVEPAGVTSLSIAPDGKSIAIARGGRSALRLDAATGKPLGEIGPHPKEVRAVAFSLDGLLATGSDGTIRLWDVAAGTVKKEFSGHPSEARSLVASPTGQWLVSTGPDTTRIWDVAAGKELTGLFRQDRFVSYYGITFVGPDRLLLGNNSGAQRVIQLPAGPELLRFQNSGGYEGSAYSSAAGLAAFRGFGGPVVSIADLTFRTPTPEEQARIEKLLREFDDDSIAVREAASAEMHQIGSVAEPALRRAMTDGPSAEVKMRAREVRKVMFDEPIRRLTGLTGLTGSIGPMAFSPDGKLFVAGSDDGTIRAFDPRNGRQLAPFDAVVPGG